MRRAILLTILPLLLLTGARPLAAQGTAALSPEFPSGGSNALIFYDATGGPLASASPVVAVIGFNGFLNQVEVTLSGSSPNWSGSFSVPSNALSIDIYFRNQASTIFDNNGGPGIDWQFVTQQTQLAHPGAIHIPAADGDGYLFRVWAPDADSVTVIGDFNGFSQATDPLRLNAATGIWTAHVPSAITGQEYKFVLDGTKFRRDPCGRQIRGGFNNNVLVDPTTFEFEEPRPTTAANYRDWVIYEMHVGSLDPAGGVAPGGFSDLYPERLDYLAALGINAVELMPVNEFPWDFSGGYNLTDPFAIERDYGTPAEFRQFVEECHARGIAVIVDIVHNHYGPSDLDLYDFQDLNDSGSGDEPGIYFYDSPTELAESGFGPRPDYSQPEVRAFIKRAVYSMVEEYNVDGFRWDFTKAIRGTVDGSFNVTSDITDGISLLQEMNVGLAALSPPVFTSAEDLGDDDRLTEPATATTGDPNDGFGFHAQWEARFHFEVVDELMKTNAADIDMARISAAIDGNFDRIHFIESHDEVWEVNGKDRVPTRIDTANPESLRSRKMSGLGAGLLLTSEGIPLIFMGSELLDIGGIDSSWNESEGIDFSRLADPDIAGFHRLYADLIALRRNLDGVSAGLLGDDTNIYHIDTTNKVIAYERSNGGSAPGDEIIVVMNFGTTDFPFGYEIGMPQAGTWYELLNSDTSIYGSDFGGVGVAGGQLVAGGDPLHGFDQRGTVFVAPRSMAIFGRAEPPATSSTGIVLK